MFRWTNRALLTCVLSSALGVPASLAHAANAGVPDAGTPNADAAVTAAFNIGRPATEAEIKAWDIDVRPDFKGLPRGSGTVDQGADIWDASCAACHGSFGESNSVFTPLVGGTTPQDIETGNVAALKGGGHPSRTTFMKVSTVSTLWDYIHRAMPWDNPKSLKPDEVYAVLAYLLNLAEIVPSDFTLSDQNMAKVQESMPNRNGMQFWEGLWTADGKPDTANTACMKDCAASTVPSSTLPDVARDAHGNLAAQMRIVGPVRGVNTLAPALAGTSDQNVEQVREHARGTLAAAQPPTSAGAKDAQPGDAAGGDLALLTENGCMACHAKDKKILGPSFADIAGKYKGQDDAAPKLAEKVLKGGSGVWGAVPMPPHPTLPADKAREMVDWILAAPAQ
ncbi:c-type cytochrome [Pusillimonas sp. TS35]|nr:c-type cytochrome [Pusillimonas sp. TS35]